MKHKFTKNEAFKFGWQGLEAFSYSSKEDFDFASAAVFHVTKRHGKCKNIVSNRIYYVLEGSGKFVIAGKEIAVNMTDVIIVPKNIEYDYIGRMTLFLVHSPAFDENNEVKLEEME